MNAPLKKLDAHLWVRHPQDWYIEPEWCSRRLFEVEPFEEAVVDPACGSGRIVRSALDFGLAATGTDIVRRSRECVDVCDFLTSPYRASNIVSNPPFGVAQEFVTQALDRARFKVAMLLPSKWMHGDKRSRWLQSTPLRRVLFLTPRPSMPPGPVIDAGISPGGGKEDFAWFVWHQGFTGIPECGWLRRDDNESAVARETGGRG